jgi:3-oxoacyl-[acyl-carrier-protein] synthase III
MTDAYIGDIVFALGEHKRAVEDSAAQGSFLSAAADLADAGFRWHHVCGPETAAYDLACAAVGQIAGRPGAGSPDAIIYATCLPSNANVGDHGDWERTRDVKHLMDFPASRLQADFGMTSSVVFGLEQQACTAMLGSLRLAHALLSVEPGWQRVLCVTADRFPPGAMYEQAYNVISDGAAACTVSRESGPFRLVTAHQITNGGLGQASDDETVGSYFGYMHKAVTQTLARAGLRPDQITWVVPQNTTPLAWTVLCRMLGISPDRVFSPSMPDVGHVIAADNMINLAELHASGRLRAGDLLLLAMAGFGMNWQCVILEATGDPGR